jgi:hypothetical protein
MAEDNLEGVLEDDAAEMQKAMLLMRPSDWIQASTECYPLYVSGATSEPAGLAHGEPT